MFFIISLLSINFLFMFMFHPLSMIFILILQTLGIATMIFYTTQFQWFSYTLILVFLGGMLILFMYMANIASNEIFKPNFFVMMLLLAIYPLSFVSLKDNLNYKVEMNSLDHSNFLNLMIFKPYSISILPVTVLLALFMILTLLAIVKISKMSQGPIRIN